MDDTSQHMRVSNIKYMGICYNNNTNKTCFIEYAFQAHGGNHPHPGLRAAAEMRKQANAQQGGSNSKGMMSVVLPMYAIGIILYLVYTLSKVSFLFIYVNFL